MELNSLSLKDKETFDRYLNLSCHQLSVYTFANIFIWRRLFDIKWAIIKGSLCVFFQNNLGCFLYLPPLNKKHNPRILEETVSVMKSLDGNRNAWRIENIEEKDASVYERFGFALRKKSDDYVCLRSELVLLKGDRFKSKRASINYFIKHNDFQHLAFSPSDKAGCLRLYDSWARQRKLAYQDSVYHYMLEDSRSSLEQALENHSRLGLLGRVIKINNRIKAFTFGCRLNKDTFCVLYEVTDLSVKGLAQFIFAKFCAELVDFTYINIMDDSGLENLKKVKLSYRPVRLVPSYIAIPSYA